MADVASGCSSTLWTGDILGLPSTCLSNKVRQPCRLAKAIRTPLAGKEMLLCKRKNFNVLPNYESQNLPRTPEAVDTHCSWRRHCWVISSRKGRYQSRRIVWKVFWSLLSYSEESSTRGELQSFLLAIPHLLRSLCFTIRKSVATVKMIVRCNELRGLSPMN